MQTVIPKLICVVGARPNFVKIAPLLQALSASQQPIAVTLVHTGQHYDAALDSEFCAALQLPRPDYTLGVGSGTQAVQTANVMMKFEPILEAVKPHAVLVVGDVNSTLACGLVASKENIPVIHVEAGLRSYDRSMPEEINRIVTDHLSSLLFTTEVSANNNLQKEGIDPNKIHFVGNIMIDTLHQFSKKAIPLNDTLEKYCTKLKREKQYALVTLHRPTNVDNPSKFEKLLNALQDLSQSMDILFPLHPRTQKRLEEFGWLDRLKNFAITTPPFNYLEMLGGMKGAQVVLTDSGGVQEETTMLRVPCITLRENTERPVTVSEGTNRLIGQQIDKLSDLVSVALKAPKPTFFPTYWDGKTANRIAAILIPWLYQHVDIQLGCKNDAQCVKY